MRCIAGKEVGKENNKYKIGNWIRPVSDCGEGEIDSAKIRLQDNSIPKIFDIVQFTVKTKEINEYQPENFCLDDEPWRKISTFPKEKIDLLIEKPTNLWLDSGCKSDRISSASLLNLSQIQSLYLIKVDCFRLELFKELNPWKDRTQNKRKIIFEYNKQCYNLSLTDPIFGNKYCNKIPNISKGKRVVDFKNNHYFCISLSAPFHGFHYKIVTTIIEGN